ncbi:hypothetical protein [Streptomyces sp. NPDC101776]|uniref:hypothetical protein n=1 Tax=Streptomyces sp. NPDC101776 TaxID=3366146 RepID=UPI0038013113
MDLSALDLETELVDLSDVPVADLGSLDSVGLAEEAARLLALVDEPPTLGNASSGGSCS